MFDVNFHFFASKLDVAAGWRCSAALLRSVAQAAYQATWNWPLASMFQETVVV